jgi:hypothetical protein
MEREGERERARDGAVKGGNRGRDAVCRFEEQEKERQRRGTGLGPAREFPARVQPTSY